MSAQSIGARLGAAREQKGLTQAQVAVLMAARGFSFHAQTVLKIEKDLRKVSFEEAVALADVYGLDLGLLASAIAVEIANNEPHPPRKSKTIHPYDEQIALAISTALAELGRSQAWLGDQMRSRGYAWSQATVWSVIFLKRPLRYAEAIDVAQVLVSARDEEPPK